MMRSEGPGYPVYDLLYDCRVIQICSFISSSLDLDTLHKHIL
jgi:hypothetical protein